MTPAFRVVLLVLAMLGVFWLGRALGPVRDEKAGVAAVSVTEGRPTPAQVARSYRLLERSAAHTRSSEPDLRLAELDTFMGQPRSAVRRLDRIVALEPRNLDAWLLLAQTARTVDPAAALRAAARVRRLSPPVPPAR